MNRDRFEVNAESVLRVYVCDHGTDSLRLTCLRCNWRTGFDDGVRLTDLLRQAAVHDGRNCESPSSK